MIRPPRTPTSAVRFGAVQNRSADSGIGCHQQTNAGRSRCLGRSPSFRDKAQAGRADTSTGLTGHRVTHSRTQTHSAVNSQKQTLLPNTSLTAMRLPEKALQTTIDTIPRDQCRQSLSSPAQRHNGAISRTRGMLPRHNHQPRHRPQLRRLLTKDRLALPTSVLS
jgi:hypothetical protein